MGWVIEGHIVLCLLGSTIRFFILPKKDHLLPIGAEGK